MEEMEQATPRIRIDEERCISCRECVETCPQTRGAQFPVFAWGDDGMPHVANPESCIECLSCEARCRSRAITVEGHEEARALHDADVRAGIKCRAVF